LGHPCKFQRVSLLGSVTARHSSSGRQPNFAALYRGRHLYLAGQPSRWALAHILVCSFFLSFFLAYSQRSEIGCLPYFHTWCGLSANLECRSEMCCTRLTGNTGYKNDAKNDEFFPTVKTCLTVGKNSLNSNNVLHVSSQYGKLRPTKRSVQEFVVPQQISRAFACLCYCSNVAHRRPTKLCTMFGCLMGCYTIYTFSGALAPDRILPVQNLTLRLSLAFSYIGSVTASIPAAGISLTLLRGTRDGITQLLPPIFGRVAITLGIGPRASAHLVLFSYALLCCNS